MAYFGVLLSLHLFFLQLVWANPDFTVSLDLLSCTFTFDPPNGSGELFTTLKKQYPLIREHDNRILKAISDHCAQSRAPACSEACQSNDVPYSVEATPQAVQQSPHVTPINNGTGTTELHPDIGIFRPELKDMKLLGRKVEDLASSVKHALLLNFDTALGKTQMTKKSRKVRERLSGQKAIDYKMLRRVGACDKHKAAKRKVTALEIDFLRDP